ncbi:MAG: PHP domain-containing protein [Terracidiphilus sp.]
MQAHRKPEALIERAVTIGMPAIALADRNGLYGAARFHTAAKRASGACAHRRGDCRAGP